VHRSQLITTDSEQQVVKNVAFLFIFDLCQSSVKVR